MIRTALLNAEGNPMPVGHALFRARVEPLQSLRFATISLARARALRAQLPQLPPA